MGEGQDSVDSAETTGVDIAHHFCIGVIRRPGRRIDPIHGFLVRTFAIVLFEENLGTASSSRGIVRVAAPRRDTIGLLEESDLTLDFIRLAQTSPDAALVEVHAKAVPAASATLDLNSVGTINSAASD